MHFFHNTTHVLRQGIIMSCLIFMMILVGMPKHAGAQRNELGLMFGGAFYMGDLNPELPMVMINPGIGGLYRLNFNHHWSVRANVLYMRVEGNDRFIAYNPDRNLSFFSDIYEFSLQGEVNFFRFQPGNLNYLMTPYLFAGAGAFMFNPKQVQLDGSIIDLHNLNMNPARENNYELASYQLMFGFGFKLNVSRFITTGIEWGMRRTGTDYLDDVSLRGNPKNNDWYSFFGAVLTFKINDPSRARCPYLE